MYAAAMQRGPDSHASDEQLEGYADCSLTESEVAGVEEHLLVCAECRHKLSDIDSYVNAMKGASGRVRRDERAAARPFFRPVWTLVPVLAAAAVILAVRLPSRVPPPYPVELAAVRGADEIEARVPAGRPLLLTLDLTGLAAPAACALDIVDSQGSSVWHGQVAPRHGKLTVASPYRFGPGRYYVRLYSPARELLREYGLETAAN
jgi:hypothetical protein